MNKLNLFIPPKSPLETATSSSRMDSAHRSPPSPDAEHPMPPVTRSALQSPPHDATPTQLKANNRPLVSTASRGRDDAVTGPGIRSPPRSLENQLVPRASSVREEAVTGSPVRSPSENHTAAPMKEARAMVTRASSMRDEAVSRSPVRSRSGSSENHTASPKETRAVVPRASSLRDETVTGSPVRSPQREANEAKGSPARSMLRDVEHQTARYEKGNSFSSVSSFVHDAENPTASPQHKESRRLVVPRASSLRDEAVTGSPVRSPQREANEAKGSPARSMLRDAEHQTARFEKENSFSSVSSFLPDAENPAALPQHKESVPGSPMKGAMTVGSVLRSPLGDVAAEDLSLEKATSPMVPVANRMVIRETTSAPRVGGRSGGGGRGSMMVESGTSRLPALTRTTVVLRILTLVLSMISFSVMAADKTTGWDGDSFDRYREFRYCLSVNVLVFVYSLFQVCVHVHHKILKRRIMSRPASYYFNFFMDQILAYLLMSASSSAASRNGDWVSDFGSDDFTKMINGSVAISFLAFLALALSSIISAYKFFTWNC